MLKPVRKQMANQSTRMHTNECYPTHRGTMLSMTTDSTVNADSLGGSGPIIVMRSGVREASTLKNAIDRVFWMS